MLRKTSQSAPARFSADEFLRIRGERASATSRDLIEMTQIVIAHIARNREVDRQKRHTARFTRSRIVQAPSPR
jgi:hypothetical protein